MNPTQEVPPLAADAPALASAEWLPETDWQELEDVRDEHRRLLHQRDEAASEVYAIEKRYDAEDKAHAEALQESIKTGEDPDLPDRTSPEKREAELAPARERVNAINKVLDDFLREAERFLEDNAGDWLSDLDDLDAQADAKREEARRMLLEAEAEVASRRKLRMWIEREAGRHPTFRRSSARHYPYGEMASPPVPGNVIDPRLAEGVTRA